jgi:hypothetical protein
MIDENSLNYGLSSRDAPFGSAWNTLCRNDRASSITHPNMLAKYNLRGQEALDDSGAFFSPKGQSFELPSLV